MLHDIKYRYVENHFGTSKMAHASTDWANVSMFLKLYVWCHNKFSKFKKIYLHRSSAQLQKIMGNFEKN